MRNAGHNILVWGLLLTTTIGCQSGKPFVALDVSGVKPSTGVEELAAVLKRCVDKQGFIDAYKYKAVAKTLKSQLKTFAAAGPDATPDLYPTDEDRLAYWYNARVGWSILLAMKLHKQEKDDVSLLRTFAFPLDGRKMDLSQIDKRIYALGGYQAVVAAACANLQRAALPDAPFDAATIRQAVKQRFVAFVDDHQRFTIDVATRQILFPPVLWKYRDSIQAEYLKKYAAPEATFTTALLPLVSGSATRRLQDAVGYACVENTAPGQLAVTD